MDGYNTADNGLDTHESTVLPLDPVLGCSGVVGLVSVWVPSLVLVAILDPASDVRVTGLWLAGGGHNK